ncbi:MAG TPA: hypothetical protein VIX63_09655, partial [Vicinamibacterales bacterium]
KRPRSLQSYYRFAVIAGKNAPFQRSAVVDLVSQDFGTDGGASNFLRMLEGGGSTVYYRGSMVTLYFSRQAVGVFKISMDASKRAVFNVPTRQFQFDDDFLDPARLPPLTPMFRDINALGFKQETRPGK